MIASLLVAFQLAVTSPAPAPSTSLVVKNATRSTTVALVPGDSGPLLRADRLRPIIPVTVTHLTANRWMLIVNGTAIQVEQGLRFARIGDETYQLAVAPDVRAGVLYIPLQLAAEIIPRVVPNLVWDPVRFELRAFSAVQRFADRAEPVSASTRRAAEPEPARATATQRAATASPARLRGRRLVVVDAGHGGPDAGMHGPVIGGPQIYEKNITLDVARRVGDALIARGVEVLYTRSRDTLIALDDRGRIANEAHADLFVSIHVNAANPGWKNPGGSRGFETYFLAEAKTEDARRVEKMENEVVKFETRSGTRAGDPLSFILNDMAQNEHLRESNELAELIQGRLRRIHPGPSRGVKQAGFRVLVTAFMPAVLVEIGFGTNPDEAAYLTDASRMNELSATVADAVVEYLQRYERRVGSSGARVVGGGELPR